MQRSTLPNPILLLLLSILLMASAPQRVRARDKTSSPESGSIFAASSTEGGHLRITRSPLLGRNVAIDITVDGKPVGSLSWGRTVDRYITPGRHVLTAWATSTDSAWRATLDVRAGQTYSYSASYNVNQPSLTPLTR
jgi:hypothetical protein